MGSTITKVCVSNRKECKEGSLYSPKFGRFCTSLKDNVDKPSLEEIKNKTIYLNSIRMYKKRKKRRRRLRRRTN